MRSSLIGRRSFFFYLASLDESVYKFVITIIFLGPNKLVWSKIRLTLPERRRIIISYRNLPVYLLQIGAKMKLNLLPLVISFSEHVYCSGINFRNSYPSKVRVALLACFTLTQLSERINCTILSCKSWVCQQKLLQ